MMDRAKARAASMPNPLKYLQRSHSEDKTGNQAPTATSTIFSQRARDPNVTDNRLLVNQKCVYERQLPGDSYITVHLTRLQKGYYDSPVIHGDRLDNCRFIALYFVFHPVDTTHRFISARIAVSLQDKDAVPKGILPLLTGINQPEKDRPSLTKSTTRRKPRFLEHAPHLLYGQLSPENLDWTFNLAGSLGVAQGPASASINPSGGIKSSYKVYKMMKIQGSLRSLNSWHGQECHIEDGQVVWTLEENDLQKSGLPREFTFVMLLTKGDAPDVVFDIDIDPVVGSWYGTYPKWWIERLWYRPLYKEPVDIDVELGQRFGPSTKKEGFNFASLTGTFDDFVTMPGTMFSRSDAPGAAAAATQIAPARQLNASPTPQTPSDLNIRVFLEGYNKHSPLNTSKHVTSSSTSQTPQSGFVISSSRTKSQNRPRSEHFPTPPLQQELASTKPRPVSAIYEHSPTLSTGENLDHPQDRPTSAITDISDDLFLTPLSPIKGLRISKSLRHSRSRPDLRGEDQTNNNNSPPHEEQDLTQNRVAEVDSDHEAEQSHEPATNTNTKPQTQSQTQPEAKILPRYPRRIGAQPMRRTSNAQTVPKPVSLPTAQASRPTSSRIQETDTAIQSHHKRLTPRQARNSSYINPVDLNHARFKLAEDSPTLPPPLQPPSFPPTSFPNFNAIASTSLNSNPPSQNMSSRPIQDNNNLLPQAPAPPPAPILPDSVLHGLGVDSLVQREVSNYLKSHPELYSPQSSIHQPLISNSQPHSHRHSHRDTDYTNNSDLNSGYQNFSMPSHIRPMTATSADQMVVSRAGPSSSGGSAGHKGGSGSGNGKHRRSQSVQHSSLRNEMVGDHARSPSYDDKHFGEVGKLRRERSFDRERKTGDNGASGEFIRVQLGGVGHGGWEYLE